MISIACRLDLVKSVYADVIVIPPGGQDLTGGLTGVVSPAFIQ
jgi:hypothetical protein